MNSPKSVEYSCLLLDQILTNPNIGKIVINYLMSSLENKNLIKIDTNNYINLNAIHKICIVINDPWTHLCLFHGRDLTKICDMMVMEKSY